MIGVLNFTHTILCHNIIINTMTVYGVYYLHKFYSFVIYKICILCKRLGIFILNFSFYADYRGVSGRGIYTEHVYEYGHNESLQ